VIFHGASETQVIDKPLQSILTQNHIGLVEPQIVKYYGTEAGTESIDDPLSTVTTKSRFGLVEPGVHPFIVQNRLYGDRKDYSRAPHDVDDPLPAITGHGAGALVNPIVLQVNHGGDDSRVKTADEPLGTVTTKRNTGVAVPVLHELNGRDVDPRRIIYIDDKPYLLDIRFRMLSNRELARAMGFDDKETEYEFVGNQADVTRQIGNAVPVNLAAALVKEILR
jgi:DNA (cytosine-5)-methyltransferase 1